MFGPVILLLSIYQRLAIRILKDMHIFIADYSQQIKCSSVNEWINKVVVYPYRGMLFSLQKFRRKFLPCTSACMNSEDIMLSERSQSLKDKILCDSTYMRCLNSQNYKDRILNVGSQRPWEGENAELLFHGYRVLQDEKN